MNTIASSWSTRDTILATARELFLEKGYDTTSVQDIITILWISKGGLYHYFSSKDEILSELIHNEALPLIEGAKGIFENSALSIREKFIAWIGMKNSFYRDRYGLLYRVFVECADISLSFRIINELKWYVKPIIEKALTESNEDIPHLKQMANLMLCSHELVFSYGLSEIQDEAEFESYLETISHIFSKVFA